MNSAQTKSYVNSQISVILTVDLSVKITRFGVYNFIKTVFSLYNSE